MSFLSKAFHAVTKQVTEDVHVAQGGFKRADHLARQILKGSAHAEHMVVHGAQKVAMLPVNNVRQSWNEGHRKDNRPFAVRAKEAGNAQSFGALIGTVKAAAHGDPYAIAGLAASVVPFRMGGDMPRLVRADAHAGHGAEMNIASLREYAHDPTQYAHSTSQAFEHHVMESEGSHPADLGYAMDFIGNRDVYGGVATKIAGLTPEARAATQEFTGRMADRLEAGLKSLRENKPQRPSDMSLDEFAASPFATFHATKSDIGLGPNVNEGIHTGTARSALDRLLSTMYPHAGKEWEKSRIIPVALRGRQFPETIQDKSSGWLRWYPQKSWEDMTPRDWAAARSTHEARDYVDNPWGYDMAHLPKSADVVPYENRYEGIGDTSFLAAHPGAVRDHLDLIRDRLAHDLRQSGVEFKPGGATGKQLRLFQEVIDAPRGLQSYAHWELLMKRLLNEIAHGKRGQNLSVARAIDNARRASYNVKK